MSEEEGCRSTCYLSWFGPGDLVLPPLCSDQYFLKVWNGHTPMLRGQSTVKEGERDKKETNKVNCGSRPEREGEAVRDEC